MAQISETAGRLPPSPRLPQLVQDLAYLTIGQRFMRRLFARYGTAFSIRLPFFGPAVVVSDPALVKELFKKPGEAIQAAEPNLGLVLGPGSSFGLQGDKHLRHRKLILPQFHGDRMRDYVQLIEAETRQETARWPDGVEFPVRESMMRVTLNTILRGVFGADGRDFDGLRTLMPKFIRLGSKLVLVPSLQRDLGRWSPWNRLSRMRAELDEILDSLIDHTANDPQLGQRTDVLSLLLLARYEDGTAMSKNDIANELTTLLVAGHETTATSLAWAFERVRRHPELLSRLVDEVDDGGEDLLQATVYEVLRTRPIIDAVAREVIAPSIELGPWTIPRGHIVSVNIGLTHGNNIAFPDADVFRPDRFLGSSPDMYTWVPFGGGVRRCPGAAFANMEMLTVLRTVLRDFELETTDAPGEAVRSRGVVFCPAQDGRVAVRRRRDCVRI